MPVVVVGTLALAGYVTVRRALDSTIDEADVEPAIDVTVIESAVEENGLRAVAETETLESAINDDELDAPIDGERLQSTVEEKLSPIEEAIAAGDIESVLDSDELDAVTDHELSAISEQEVIEGTIDEGELGVSVDLDELRSVLQSGAGTLERTTTAVAERIDADGSMLDTGSDEPTDGGTRIAVIDERGGLDSLVDETAPETTADSRSAEIEDRNGQTDELDSTNKD